MDSSKDIPLQVIYNRLESSGISMQSKSVVDQSSYFAPESTSQAPAESTPKKKKSTHCCLKVFACLWALFLMFMLVSVVGTLVYSYFRVKGCVHSKNFELTEMIAVTENVKEINFNVVTGAVVVGTHEDDTVVVKLYKTSREKDDIEDINASLDLSGGVLSIISESPAFEFGSCQFSYIEVFFPEEIAATGHSPIHITGNVLAGFVELGFLESVGKVSLNVDVGGIEIEAINSESLEVETGLGYISAEAVFASERASFEVGTGSIDTEYIMSPEFESSTTYGSTWNRDISSDDASASTKYGYAALLRPIHLNPESEQNIEVEAFYGKAIASYDQEMNVDFTVGGEHGEHAFVFDSECTLDEEQSTELLAIGGCELAGSVPSQTHFDVSAKYGDAIFVQSDPDPEDDFNDEYDDENDNEEDAEDEPIREPQPVKKL